MVTGVYKPTDGEVYYGENHEKISHLRPDQIAKLGICRTFQNIRLFKELSVFDNVFIGGHLRLRSGLFSSVLRLPMYNREEKEMTKKAEYLLEKVGLFEKEMKRPILCLMVCRGGLK